MSIKIKNKNGEWVVDQKAIQTTLLDIGGNYEAENVEGALREIAEKIKNGPDTSIIESDILVNKKNITSLGDKVELLEADVEWLKENGGGGGGGVIVPTISSTFEDCSIDKGQDLTIPLFFTSPSGGTGTAFITVNNIEIDTVGNIRQGNNNIKILGKHLTSTDNTVNIYVRDRAGIASNQLTWKIIAGGITLTTTFDYESDYGITDTIKIPYTVETGIEGEIKLFITVDGTEHQQVIENGYNEYILSNLGLGLGAHTVSMYTTVGKYKSNIISFNVAIVSTTELYLSSSFVNGSKYAYGVPIPVNYRLSKLSTETYTVYLMIDGKVAKTQRLPVGSYYWTVTELAIGIHTLTVRAVSDDNEDDKSLDLTLEIEKGVYTPVEDYKFGLLCDLNATGKNNQDSTGDTWIDESGNNNNGNLIGFNFSTNGFINDELICDNDAYVEIPWSPWASNATNGSTIDIIYTPINSGVEECRAIDYTSITDNTSTAYIKPFKGVFADITQAISSSSSSGQSAGKLHLDDESGEIHLTWVLDRVNKFMKTYINGVLSRIMYLTDSGEGVNKFYEDFSHDNYIYLNSTKGQNIGTCNIKRFRVYGHALTSDQVLQNNLANIKNLDIQEEMYNFNYNNSTLPKMKLYGDMTHMTPDQSVDMRIEYTSPNEEKYGPSFSTGIQNNPVKIQGTSSLAYVLKNYTIYLKDEYGVDMMYNPYGEGGVDDNNIFCLKADYVESSHANNVGCAKFINDCVYDTKLPPQLDNPKCRSAINGFPIELYLNGKFNGIYNFNYDRFSYTPYGYDYKTYPNILVYEINSNSNVSAGAFYQYGENAESSANISERDYYARDFKLIYGNRTTNSDTLSEIKELVEWVSIAEYDLFRETLDEHFNREYLFRYLLTVLLLGGVDSLGKNVKLVSFDGRKWFFTFYDIDTVIGMDNSGYLTIETSVEIEEGSFNTSNSNLWTKVMEFFAKELKEEWALMRQKNFTLDNLMKYLYDEQISKIPANFYNIDAQTKYLDFGSLYTYCCHGSKEHLMKRWLRERIAYVDSMLEYFTSQHEQIILRMNKTGKVAFNITSYIPLYFSVKWSNAQGGIQTIKVDRGKSYEFSYTSTTSTDQEVIIYHSHHVKRLDNLTNLNVSSCLLGNATKITEVEIHSPLLYNVNVTENKYLRKLDLSGCKALGTVVATGSTLDLSKCKYLNYVNTYDTALTAITLDSKGGSIREIYYPTTLQSLTITKQPLLEILGLPYGSTGEEIPTALYSIDIRDCMNIKKMNTSTNNLKNQTMASMVYCNKLTIRNSLTLKELLFDGFKRLKNVTIENMPDLTKVGFDNLLESGNVPTLGYVGLSNCPKLTNMTLNCSSNAYEVSFIDNGILDLGKLTSLRKIASNTSIKGLKTVIVPKQLQDIDFNLKYGTGVTSVENIWVSDVCSVNTDGVTATAIHINPKYTGIDFKGMTIKTIDMNGFGKITNAINFNIAPTTINPNLNTSRDGSTDKPWFRPSGTLDLSGYELDWKGIFKGLDLDTVEIIMPNGSLEDSDISSLFEGCVFQDATFVNDTIAKFSNANNLNYIFKNSDITSATKIKLPKTRFTLKGGFTNSKLVSDIDLPLNVIDVTECFKDCLYIKNATSNWNKKFSYAISFGNCYTGCKNITYIDGSYGYIGDIPYEWGGYGFSKDNIGIYVVEIPQENYRVVLGDLLLDGTIEWGDGTQSNSNIHIYKDQGIYTIKGKVLPNISGLVPDYTFADVILNVNALPVQTHNFENMFANCGILRLVNLSSVNTGNVETTRRMFYNNISMVTPPEFDFSSAIDIREMYAGCISVLTLKFKNLINKNLIAENIFTGCSKLVTLMFTGKAEKSNVRKLIDNMEKLVNDNNIDVATLSTNVDVAIEDIRGISKQQYIQDCDIETNLMASADIFEMVLDLMPMSISSYSISRQPGVLYEEPITNSQRGDSKMVEVYVSLIIKGRKTIDDVPAIIRPQVESMLKDLCISI